MAKHQVTTFSIANTLYLTLGIALFFSIFSGLSGCAALPDKPVRPTVYDFGPGESASSPGAGAAGTLAALTLADIEAPAALDGTAMLYRLAYADVQQLRLYAQARWSMAPAQLVRQRLREQLGRHRVVLNTGETGAAVTLRLELEEFSQVFETPARSSGLVRLRATLIDEADGRGRPRAQRSFAVERSASSADAPGGVRALTAATDAAIAEIANWLAQQMPGAAR